MHTTTRSGSRRLWAMLAAAALLGGCSGREREQDPDGDGDADADADADADGDADGDGDADADADADGDAAPSELDPLCPAGGDPCPDDLWFGCAARDAGGVYCLALQPVGPDRGEWDCRFEGSHDLHDAELVCRGPAMPAEPGAWECTEADGQVTCRRDAFWPDNGDEQFWDCYVLGDELSCDYVPGVLPVCEAEPCPHDWFVCEDEGYGPYCVGQRPATPVRGNWACTVEGSHDLAAAEYVCVGTAMPADPGPWSCVEAGGEVTCRRPAYWPDTGGDGVWSCFYLSMELACQLTPRG